MDVSPNIIFNVVYTSQNLIWDPFSLEIAHTLERTFAETSSHKDTNNFLVIATLTFLY